MVGWGEGYWGGLHERVSHHTNVCKIPRLCGAVSLLVCNKSLSNWSTSLIFLSVLSSPVDRFSLTGASQWLKKIMDRKPGQISTCLISIGHFRGLALDPIGLNPLRHLIKFTQRSTPYPFGFEY